jgi:hypothetical protein
MRLRLAERFKTLSSIDRISVCKVRCQFEQIAASKTAGVVYSTEGRNVEGWRTTHREVRGGVV